MDISSQAPPREGVGAGAQVARDGLKTRVRARARGARRAGLASRSGAPSRSAAPAHPASPQLNAFRERTARRGVNPFVYWPVRALLVPALLIYFRTRRIGREHLPRGGPLLFASNHRSFLDPFIIGTLLRRPVYYMAKRELFERRWQAWILNALGAFPVDRGIRHPARFTGRTDGRTLGFTALLTDTGQSFESGLLVLGREPSMRNCPICRRPPAWLAGRSRGRPR